MIALHVAVFLGAFLLFLVQPLVAKQILPWFGGAPAVWSTSLVFFQIALVVGYAYAHLTRRLGTRTQMWLHLGLLVAALALLPIVASPAWKPQDAEWPAWRVLMVLLYTVGGPYTLLAATAPLLQDWYAKVRPREIPYRLYALSNAGSLIALLSFPTLVEPFLASGAQAWLWSAGFLGFVIVVAWSALTVARAPSIRGVIDSQAATPPTALDQFLWYCLAACGTGMLLAVTNQLCQEVAAVPLLWVVPLALYLTTFILCFAGWIHRAFWRLAFLATAVATAYVLMHAARLDLAPQAFTLLALLASACMVCHGELARLKPEPEFLTRYYLSMSVGGGIGGLFVALVAPAIFNAYTEFLLFVLMTGALVAAVVIRDRTVTAGRQPPVFLWALPLAAFLTTAGIAIDRGAATAATVAVGRNFYGVLRVADSAPSDPLPRRGLFHGRVLHGAQFQSPDRRLTPATDFASGSGIARTFASHPKRAAGAPLRVAVVGLGVGAIAAFGRAGDSIRFYELNPQVIDFARAYFTFLRESPAAIDVVPGDARISLEQEMSDSRRRHAYDLLVVDAFAGASIPVHLLTRESFALYDQALAPGGVLAIHVSNQHLNLAPVVRGAAGEQGRAVLVIAKRPDASVGATASQWAVISRDRTWLMSLGPGDPVPETGAPDQVWTDSFSSVTSVLSFAPQWYLVDPR